MSVLLIVVEGVVLHAGRHAVGLQSLYVRHDHTACQEGVLAHVFRVATAQGSAVNVDTGAQYHVFATVKGFLSEAQTVDTGDRKSTRLNSSHANISYAVFCL